MPASMQEFATTRAVVTRLLDELKLEAYLFEIEPRDGSWEVRLECAVEGGWEIFRLGVKKEYLLRGVDEVLLHDMLLDDWQEALSACRKRT